MKHIKLLPVSIAAALAVAGFVALETPAIGASPHPGFRHQMIERVKERLGLTEEQSAQIKEAILSDKDAIADLVERMHEARTELRDTIRSTDATEDAVRAAADKLAVVQSDAAVQRMKSHAKISPILTDEQRSKIAQFEARMEIFRGDILDRIAERLAE